MKNLYTRRRLLPLLLFLAASCGVLPLRSSAQGGSSPLATCPANIVKYNDPGQCGAITNFSATPANSNVTIVYSKQPGALFPVGSTDVVVTAYDIYGYTSTCKFNVNITDNEAPSFINYAANVAVNTGVDSCSAVVNYTKPTVFQNCTWVSKSFNYTGGAQTFTVPAGVYSLSVDLTGAQGGRAASFDGYPYGYPGFGGRTEATIPVVPGQVLTFYLGGQGKDGNATVSGLGGYNGGAAGGSLPGQYTGGGGGGASDIRFAPYTINDRVVVAGGGGGCGYFGEGGHGGDLVGASGYGYGTDAFGGGQTAGGAGAVYASTYSAASGTFGVGGAAATGVQSGGGGGGWYGGGGGAFGDGGGGSSYTIPSASSVLHTQGYQEGDGTVTFIWSPPTQFEQISGLPPGSVFPYGTTVNTFKSVDAVGNAAQCTVTVTVSDNQKPKIQAPANVTVNSDNGSCGAASVALGTPVTSDNCGVASVTNNAPSSYPIGTTNIVWTVTDIHGNVSTATQTVTVVDNQPPVLTVPPTQTFTSPGSLMQLPALTASDNCGIASVSYNITGATVRNGNNGDASGSFNSGLSYINWTVKDVNGNASTATTTIDVRVPQAIQISMSDVWAVSPWGAPNTLYIGFGPATMTLKVRPTTGTPPYTYEWSKVGNTAILSRADSLVVSAEGDYTAKITDAARNTGSITRHVYMVDTRCGNDDKKVAICHMPNGDPSKAKTICVGAAAAPTFLGNGNYLGPCTNRIVAPEAIAAAIPKAGAYPNPSYGKFSLQLNNKKATKADVVILSSNGKVVTSRTQQLTAANQLMNFDLAKPAPGLYVIKVTTEEGVQTYKLIIEGR